MQTKPLASLACCLTAGALILPACGGEEAPDAKFAPADDVRVLEQRLGAVERQLRDMRQEIRSQGEAKRSSSDEPRGDTAGDGAAERGGASAPVDSGGRTRAASVSGSDSAGGRSGSGRGGGSGGGGLGGSDGGGVGGSDAGAGPDPGTPEDDPSIEDICGPNPAPEC